MPGGNVAGRPADKAFALQFRGGPTGLPDPGSTEHALLILVMLEIAALILLRRYFRSAHGG
jgi:hypothetical protein